MALQVVEKTFLEEAYGLNAGLTGFREDARTPVFLWPLPGGLRCAHLCPSVPTRPPSASGPWVRGRHRGGEGACGSLSADTRRPVQAGLWRHKSRVSLRRSGGHAGPTAAAAIPSWGATSAGPCGPAGSGWPAGRWAAVPVRLVCKQGPGCSGRRGGSGV